MGTKVLYPHDSLVDRVNVPTIVVPYQRTNFSSHNRKSHYLHRTKAVVKPNRNSKEFLSRITKRSNSKEGKTSPKIHMMGQFTLVRRGESINSFKKNLDTNENIRSIEKIDPYRRTMQQVITIEDSCSKRSLSTSMGIYAGSGFIVSPSPESLPLPSFSKKMATIDGLATQNLRRLLGLH